MYKMDGIEFLINQMNHKRSKLQQVSITNLWDS